MAVKITMLFWVVTPCGLVGSTNVSEKHTVSIFRAEEGVGLYSSLTLLHEAQKL
jgi:hypothetical protein